jgi:HAD superfamily hydrolase (TIGR01459 family)
MEIIRSLADVSSRYDAVFCDLWGCLHNGVAPFPAAVAALQAYRAQGGVVLLLTNAPRPKTSVVRQLQGMGVPADCYDEVVSSGDAAQMALVTGAVGRRVHFIGAAKDQTFFTDLSADVAAVAASAPPIMQVPLTEAEGIVCTGLVDDRTETPDDYRAALLLAKTRGLPMLCANPDIIVDMGDTRLYCAGALAQAYEAMGGTALYFGKPHPPIYDLARRRLAALVDSDDPQILCIGDGIATDIQGGLSEGIDTLYVTGGIDTLRFGADAGNPDGAKVSAFLDEKMVSATYAIGHLR